MLVVCLLCSRGLFRRRRCRLVFILLRGGGRAVDPLSPLAVVIDLIASVVLHSIRAGAAVNGIFRVAVRYVDEVVAVLAERLVGVSANLVVKYTILTATAGQIIVTEAAVDLVVT